MLLFEPQNLLDLPVSQRRLPFLHFPCERHARTLSLQENLRRFLERVRVVRRIEHLKPQAFTSRRQITHLTQIPRVNVRPRIPLTARRILDE